MGQKWLAIAGHYSEVIEYFYIYIILVSQGVDDHPKITSIFYNNVTKCTPKLAQCYVPNFTKLHDF